MRESNYVTNPIGINKTKVNHNFMLVGGRGCAKSLISHIYHNQAKHDLEETIKMFNQLIMKE